MKTRTLFLNTIALMFMGITLVQEQASAQYDIERNLFPIQYQGKEGCINKSGELVITPRFDKIYCYSSEEKIVFQLDGKYGFVNKNDDIVIGPLFDGISIYQGFREGLASVQKGKKHGFVNAAGEFVIEPQFESAEAFEEGLAAVKINGKWGFIDKIGTFVIEPKFDHVDNFHDGLSRVEIYGKMGVIDRSGKFTIPPIFDKMVGKTKGYHPDYPVPAFINGAGWGLINRRGEFVVKPQFDEVAGYFNYNPGEFTGMDTPLPVRSGRQWGYIDVRTGAWVVKPQFDQAYQFSEGLAPVTVGGKTGFIDKNGQFIIKPKFDTVYGFKRGKDLVGIGKKYALIDRNGRSIQIEFDWINEAGDFTEADLFTVSYVDERRTLRRAGYVNLLGNYVTDKNVTKLPKKAEVAKRPDVKPIESKIPPDYAGNSPNLTVARKISSTGKTQFDDWVGIVDRDDYYSLTLDKKSSITFEANDAIGLSILDSNGIPATIISEQTGTPYTKENVGKQVKVILNPGTYYLKVSEIFPKFDDPKLPLNGVFYKLTTTIEDVKVTKYLDARKFTVAQVLNSQDPKKTQAQLDTIDAISKRQYTISSKIPDTELLRKSLSDTPINEGEYLGIRKSFSYRDYLSLRMNLLEQSKAISYAKEIVEKNMDYLSYLEESSDSEARKIQADTSSSFVGIYNFSNLSSTPDIKRRFIIALEETRVSTQKLVVGSIEAGLEASKAWTPLGDVLDAIKGYDNLQLLSDFDEIRKYLEEITPIVEEMRGYSKKGDLVNTELKLLELANRTIKWTDDLKALGKEAKYVSLTGNLVFQSKNILSIHDLKQDDNFKGVLTSFDITYLTSAQISSGLQIFDSFMDVLPEKIVVQKTAKKISSSFDVLMKAFAFNYEQSTSREYRNLLKQERDNQKILEMYSSTLNSYVTR